MQLYGILGVATLVASFEEKELVESDLGWKQVNL